MRRSREPFVIGRLEDGFWTVRVPGVEQVIDLWIANVSGRPEIVELRIRGTTTQCPYETTFVDVDQLFRQFDGTYEERRLPITVELLRSLPLARMKAAVLERLNEVVVDDPDDPIGLLPAESRIDAGGGLSEAFLQRVAREYRDAVTNGLHPLVTIAKTENVSKAAAQKWVRMARERGLLGYPDRPGRPGFTEDQSPWKSPAEVWPCPVSTDRLIMPLLPACGVGSPRTRRG